MTIVDTRFAVSYYNDTWDWSFEARNSLDFVVEQLNGTTEKYSYTEFDLYPPIINDELRDESILITFPYSGYSVSQSVEMIWYAVIPFGSDFNYSIIIINDLGQETIIASNIQNNSFIWDTTEFEDGIYSIKITGENEYFSTYALINSIEIENATSDTNDDASLSFLLIIELLVIVSIVIRRKNSVK